MTAQEVKARLSSVYIEYRAYKLAEEKCEQFRDLISAPAPVGYSPDTPTLEHPGNSTENKIVAALWYSEEVDKRFRAYILASQTVEGMISELKYYDQREVLTRRYIMFEKWSDIQKKMHISRTRLFRLHDRAIIEMVTKKET
jgi:DNA-directed RNA polymerase specialized sigma subunit